MIASPHNYSDWVVVFEILKEKTDDHAAVEAIQQGSIAWQTGVAERFSKQLVDVVNFRMNAATDKFQKDLSRASGNEGAIVQALISLRKELLFLLKVVDIQAIPEKDRGQYIDLVRDQMNQIQSSLEDSAKIDRSGKLLSIIRNNKVIA